MVHLIRNVMPIALLVTASMAHAAGLGKLTVNSSLGQVLDAQIDLVSVQPGEVDTLSARVASREAYQEARMDYSTALRGIVMTVEKRANNQPYLKVTSASPVNEPSVNMLVDLTWQQGRVQRLYPILLDPRR